MDLNKKIEEIKQKPENIRLRYVWGLVSISMLFVITIWVLSVKESAKSLHLSDSNLPDISQSLENITSIKNSAPSINDIANGVQELENLNEEASSVPSQIDESTSNSLLPISNN